MLVVIRVVKDDASCTSTTMVHFVRIYMEHGVLFTQATAALQPATKVLTQNWQHQTIDPQNVSVNTRSESVSSYATAAVAAQEWHSVPIIRIAVA